MRAVKKYAPAVTVEQILSLPVEEQRALYAFALEADAKRLQDSFLLFIRNAFTVLEPETEYRFGWHLAAMAAHLEAVHRGELRNLIINIPPRHMKSLSVSVMFPAWEWATAPALKYICASYGAHLALRDAVKMRRLVTSSWYRERWPHVVIQGDQAAKESFENTRGGYRVSVGVGGAIAGQGGDRLIVDDAHKTQEGESQLAREAVYEWWRSTMISRAQDPKTVAKIIIGQRVHEADLPGELLSEGGWTHLNLPAEYETKPFVYVKALPPLTRDPREKEGELLWPVRFGPEEVAQAKKAGSYHYSAQFQQRPAPAGGGLIKREWFKFYELDPDLIARDADEVIQSWDLAFKSLETSDRVSGQVWARKGANCYLLYRINERLNFPATRKAIVAVSARWPQALLKLVEDKANGPAIIDDLKHEVPGLLAVEPRGSKEARAAATSPAIEAGNVWLPHPRMAPWVEDFLAECSSFPKGAHDDDVDAMTQALDRLLVAGATWDMQEYAELVHASVVEPQTVDPSAWRETVLPSGSSSRMATISAADAPPLPPEQLRGVFGW